MLDPVTSEGPSQLVSWLQGPIGEELSHRFKLLGDISR